jgi:hypothetical protein
VERSSGLDARLLLQTGFNGCGWGGAREVTQVGSQGGNRMCRHYRAPCRFMGVIVAGVLRCCCRVLISGMGGMGWLDAVAGAHRRIRVVALLPLPQKTGA